jgi:hypothetical protein
MKERNAFEKAILGNKRALQGGVYNYLGKQETVNAPLKWKSSPEHPVAYLTYITKEEADILIKKNIYGSLKDGKPNRGPFGIASLQGSGGGAGGGGGDSGGDSGNSPGPGDNAPGGGPGSPGPGGGPGGDSQDAGPGSPGPGGGPGPGPGPGPGGNEDDNTQSPGPNSPGLGLNESPQSPNTPSFDTIDTLDTVNPPMETMVQDPTPIGNPEIDEPQTPPGMARLSPIGILAYDMSLNNPTRSTAQKAMGFAMSPVGTTLATIADANMRGLEPVNDFSQLTESVQTNTPGVNNPTGGGLGSFENTYKPLDNSNAYIPYTRKPFFTMDPLTGVFKSLI